MDSLWKISYWKNKRGEASTRIPVYTHVLALDQAEAAVKFLSSTPDQVVHLGMTVDYVGKMSPEWDHKVSS